MDSSNKETFGTNPFLALFSNNFGPSSHGSLRLDQELTKTEDPLPRLVSVKDQEKQTENTDLFSALSTSKDTEIDGQIINDILQRVFLITLNNGKKHPVILLVPCVYQ